MFMFIIVSVMIVSLVYGYVTMIKLYKFVQFFVKRLFIEKQTKTLWPHNYVGVKEL